MSILLCSCTRYIYAIHCAMRIIKRWKVGAENSVTNKTAKKRTILFLLPFTTANSPPKPTHRSCLHAVGWNSNFQLPSHFELLIPRHSVDGRVFEEQRDFITRHLQFQIGATRRFPRDRDSGAKLARNSLRSHRRERRFVIYRSRALRESPLQKRRWIKKPDNKNWIKTSTGCRADN